MSEAKPVASETINTYLTRGYIMKHHTIYLYIALFTLSLPLIAQISGQQSTSNPEKAAPTSKIKTTSANLTSEYLDQPQFIIPEGNMIIDRTSKLARHKDGRWFLIMSPPKKQPVKNKLSIKPSKTVSKSPQTSKQPNKPLPSLTGAKQFTVPLEILPNKWLTSMIKACGDKVNLDITFRIWGEVTVYEKRNYILLTLVATGSTFGDPKPTTKSTSKLDSMFGSPDKPVENTDNTKEDEKQKLLLAENIRTRLLAIPRPHTLKSEEKDSDDSTANDNTSNGGSKTRNSQWKDGKWISNKLGRLRLNKKDLFYEFVFESGNSSAPPVIVHPCQALQSMEAKVNRTHRSIKFKVSGKISTYKNNTYILPKTQMETTSDGNLGR